MRLRNVQEAELTLAAPEAIRAFRPQKPIAAELAIIIPTFNERGNVARIVDQIDAALAGIAWLTDRVQD